jgi:cellulose synthase/poly-beta-1,6-N-acetylglucosamine synthase-like glycosyltransferase
MIFSILAWTLAGLTIPGTVELALLTFGWLRAKPILEGPEPKRLKRLTVVVPAHNESGGIARTVNGLLACPRPEVLIEVLVIADNCSDDTAAQARAAGQARQRAGFLVTVLERSHAELRGKGHALHFAFTTALARPAAERPDAFLVIDADTKVSSTLFTAATKAFERGVEALQAPYHSGDPEASMRARLQHLALLAFNHLRPKSREHLGLSVGILGNGFGLTARTLEHIPYTAASIVEDLEYHIQLVRAGLRVRFLADAVVAADAPPSLGATKTQRSRWEGGRLRMIQEHAPRLAAEVLKGRLRLLEPLLELLLLPLGFHVTLLLLALAVPGPAAHTYLFWALALLPAHILCALKVGKGNAKDLFALALAPFYVLWKLLLLPRLFATSRRSTSWKRTERSDQEQTPPAA